MKSLSQEILLRKDLWNVAGQHQGLRTINLKCLSPSSSCVNCWAIMISSYLLLSVIQLMSCQDHSSMTLIIHSQDTLFILCPKWKIVQRSTGDTGSAKGISFQLCTFFFFRKNPLCFESSFVLKAAKESLIYSELLNALKYRITLSEENLLGLLTFV